MLYAALCIHIGDAVMHQGVHETVTFDLPRKRKRGKKYDTNVKIGNESKGIYNER